MDKWFKILSVFFLLLFSSQAWSFHIIGGDFQYICNGNGSYTIIFKMYRDCSSSQGADFDGLPSAPPAEITIFRGSSALGYSIFQEVDMGRPEITNINPDTENPCLIVPPNLCVEQGIYTFDIFLPPSEESYFIVYQRCCRNITITNVHDPGDIGSTFFLEITPEAQELCSDSPEFDAFPPIVICVDAPFEFDHSASDNNPDTRLEYEFCSPYEGGGKYGTIGFPNLPNDIMGVTPQPESSPPYTPVNFISPLYSAGQPVSGNPPLTIDPISGVITGFPDIVGQYVVGVCVKQYKGDTLLSVIQRDFQFNVTYCEQKVFAEIVADSLSSDVHIIRSCGSLSVNFINKSRQEAFINDYWWSFEVEGGDTITSSEKDPLITFPDTGIYNGTMIVNRNATQCSDTAEIKVLVYPGLEAAFDYSYDTCIYGPVSFINNSYSNGGDIIEFQWDLDEDKNSQEQNPSVLYEGGGFKDITLEIKDVNMCTDSISRTISYFPLPPEPDFSAIASGFCHPSYVLFTDLTKPLNDAYEYVWHFGDGEMSEEINPLHVYEEPGIYDVKLNITSPAGCEDEIIKENLLHIVESPEAAFSYSPSDLDIFNKTAEFTDESLRSASVFWIFDSLGISFDQNPSFTFPDTGTYQILQVAKHENGCRDTFLTTLFISDFTSYYLPNAFSPNGDGVNEIYKGTGYTHSIADFSFTILNRYGDVLFETDDPEKGWNGRLNNEGVLLPQDVYVCVVTYVDHEGKSHTVKSFATLLL